MEIRTERLRLVPAGIMHLERTHEYASDPETTRYMMFLPYASKEETAESLRRAEAEWKKPRPAFYDFAVMAGETQIGGVSLYLNEARDEGELGWILHRDFQGRGYAMEAAQALIGFAEALGIRKLTAHCDSANAPSRRLIEALSMALAGEWGGRRNRGSDEERRECLYRLTLPEGRS